MEIMYKRNVKMTEKKLEQKSISNVVVTLEIEWILKV